ncbi:MAG TPA: HEPN domain-containing protein [Candidatus Binatia bacterium]|nr:HEPN domain-containing protein [Candidatus Binatia bacterium]
MSLDRAREALEAAQVCLGRNLPHSATSRAYYAMFWAAQAALAHVGIRRAEWSHPALQASFVTELIRRRKRYPALLGPYFNRALQLRLDADYRVKGVSQKQAAQVVHWAQELIAVVIKEVSSGPDIPDSR